MSRFYNHLSLDERRKIYSWREEKISVNEIAKRLGRHRSTILGVSPKTKCTQDFIDIVLKPARREIKAIKQEMGL